MYDYPAQCASLSYKFTGKERDSESGLDNFIARYDSSSLGRFMSPDPGQAAGWENQGDPQSWNGYAYARNNPLLYTDPDGDVYQLCDNSNHCTNVSDADFEKNFQNAKNVQLDGNQISIQDANGNFNKEGTFKQTSVDDALSSDAITIFADINRRNVLNNTLKIAGAGALIGATGGAACYYLCPAATVTTIGVTAARVAPLLPVVAGAIEKLQKLGISLEEANEIVESPASQKLVDNLNAGNINVIQEVGGKLVRITLDPSGQRIISAGLVRANQVANGIANGRFVPKQ